MATQTRQNQILSDTQDRADYYEGLAEDRRLGLL